MKLTDIIEYRPVYVDGNSVETTGPLLQVTVADLVALVDAEAGSVTAAQITDAGAFGRTMLQNALVADARTDLGLGTIYPANQVANIAAEGGDFASLTTVTTAWNGLLAALKTAGVMVDDV